MVIPVMSKILEGLYVGDIYDARNRLVLDMNHVTHIVSVLGGSNDLFDDRCYLCVVAEDTVGQNLMQFFSICNDFIHSARLSGNGVLIHCLVGASRSVTIACAYVLAVTDLCYDDAFEMIRSKRIEACPNLGFKFQLQQYEKSCLAEEKERLAQQFPMMKLRELDERICMEFLANKDKRESSGSTSEKSFPLVALEVKEEVEKKVEKKEVEKVVESPMNENENVERTSVEESEEAFVDKVPSAMSFTSLFPKNVRKPFLKKSPGYFTSELSREGLQLMTNVCLYQPLTIINYHLPEPAETTSITKLQNPKKKVNKSKKAKAKSKSK